MRLIQEMKTEREPFALSQLKASAASVFQSLSRREVVAPFVAGGYAAEKLERFQVSDSSPRCTVGRGLPRALPTWTDGRAPAWEAHARCQTKGSGQETRPMTGRGRDFIKPGFLGQCCNHAGSSGPEIWSRWGRGWVSFSLPPWPMSTSLCA